MAQYDVAYRVNALVTRRIEADTLDEALERGRKVDGLNQLFAPKRAYTWIDGDVTVVGVDELE